MRGRWSAILGNMHDPGHVILRRALRVGLLVPVTYFVIQGVLGWSNAALASAFACFSMLAFADLGGPRRERFAANALLGLNGVVLVALGSYLGQWPGVIVAVTLVIVFVIAYSAVLRGYFAAATAAAILPWVFAATATPDPELTVHRAVGWAIGAAVATIGSVTLWPMFLRSTLRLRLADVLSAAAEVQRNIDDPQARAEAFDDLREAHRTLRAAYDGHLARPGAGTARDRSLMQAIEETGRLLTTLEFTHDQLPDLGPTDADLNAAIVTALEQCAEALRSGDVVPNPAALDAQREAHAEQLAKWCNDKFAAGQSQQVRPGVEGSATVRTISLTVEAMTIYVRGAMDPTSAAKAKEQRESASADVVTFAGHEILEPDQRVSPWTLLRRQFTFHSPWLRTAIRTSVAITLTVYIVTLLGAEHGFWASLGALVALKFDASGTQRMAWQMVFGTIIGFAVGSLLVLGIGDHAWPMWLLLPVAAFLAAYTPGAISFVIGQASFSVFVIILLGITSPGELSTAEWRLADVLIGIGVSLFVSLLMWPHGVAPMVYRTARKAIYASSNYLMYGYERIVDGTTSAVHSEIVAKRSAEAVDRATEAFDLAYSQRGPALAHSDALVATINVANALNYFGEVLGGLSKVGPLPHSCAASGDSMLAAAHRVGTRIVAIVNAMDDREASAQYVADLDQHRASLERLRATIDHDFATLGSASVTAASSSATSSASATSPVTETPASGTFASGTPATETPAPTSVLPAPATYGKEPASPATATPLSSIDAGHTAVLLVLSLAWIIQSVWLADRLESTSTPAQPRSPSRTTP